MNEIKSIFGSLYSVVLSYVVHLAFVSIAAFALHWGFHISIPVLPGSLTTFSVLAFGRLVLGRLAHAWHSGRLEAELEADAKKAASSMVNQIIAAAEGKAGAAKAA